MSKINPPQQPKTDEVVATLNELAQSKSDGEVIAKEIAVKANQDGLYRLMSAVAKSERIIAEDIVREAGFMLPQSDNAHKLLEEFIINPPSADFPTEIAKKILEKIPNNEETENNKDNNKEEKGDKTMAKWVCPVCGYIHEGETAPAECPVCHVSGEKFTKVEGELKLAAEHEYGVYAKTVKDNADISEEDKKYIKEQLMANFTGECSEVGMYLCMARIAHREGYPEIGLYWEKAAFEEAEHAAKFAELLGSELEPNMKATTKDNLKWRVDCEFGATQGKFDLAMCAKKNNLDAIHDTVHEMARDEARHGKALKGMLDRYFK